jgi:hypothetical protein
MRPELAPLPPRMQQLAVDERGYPVPFFVAYIDGKPDHRIMDPQKWKRAVHERLCWTCGQKLGAHLCFVLGPMCGINRTTTEPPTHLECARWSVVNCPFLSRPRMDRREREKMIAAGAGSIGGFSIDRNPGVSMLWITRTYEIWRPDTGGVLIEIGPAESVEWWYEGRAATRAEVAESVRTGLPFLEEKARLQEGAMEELQKLAAAFEEMYPA